MIKILKANTPKPDAAFVFVVGHNIIIIVRIYIIY
jgi:hypothetical protein